MLKQKKIRPPVMTNFNTHAVVTDTAYLACIVQNTARITYNRIGTFKKGFKHEYKRLRCLIFKSVLTYSARGKPFLCTHKFSCFY